MSPSPCARKSTTRAPLNLAHAYGMETGAKGARIEASEGRVRRSRPIPARNREFGLRHRGVVSRMLLAAIGLGLYQNRHRRPTQTRD